MSEVPVLTPVEAIPASAAPVAEPSPKRVAPILYIEDEEDYRILVKDILQCAGLEVVTAETGKEGLEALLKIRPSVLILDINLPDTDGHKICRQLRQDPAYIDLPILMLTVRRRPEEWLRGFSSGANDYVSKPIDPADLVERVVNCLEGKAHPFSGDGSPEYNLIRAAVSGNRAAFEVLIQQYRDRLIGSLKVTLKPGSMVEDIVAQAFALAYEQLGQFRGEASFYTWVYRIALHEAENASAPSSSVSLDALTDGDEGTHPAGIARFDSPETTLDDRQAHAQALKALDKVPGRYRRVLEMYFLDDLAYETIAKTLRIPIGTVKSRLFKARKLLQSAWQRRTARAESDVAR